jgi:hypothetical protein
MLTWLYHRLESSPSPPTVLGTLDDRCTPNLRDLDQLPLRQQQQQAQPQPPPPKTDKPRPKPVQMGRTEQEREIMLGDDEGDEGSDVPKPPEWGGG